MKFKEGDILSRLSYVKVKSVNGSIYQFENEDGTSWNIARDIAEEECISSSLFEKEVLLPKTKLAQILTTTGDKAFTVCYTKADGSERVLVGHRLESNNLLGYSMVVDLTIAKEGDGKNRIRTVNHNTLKYLIFNNTKYILKT
jgi:hypothetical protein